MPTAFDDNFLALEDILIARLQEAVPEFQQVAGYNDLDRNVFAEVRKNPACFVIFDGVGRPKDQAGSHSLIERQWGVVIAVRGGNDKAATRAQLGALITKTMQALHGFKAPSATGRGALPLRLLSGPAPRYFDGGHAVAVLVYGERCVSPYAA